MVYVHVLCELLTITWPSRLPFYWHSHMQAREGAGGSACFFSDSFRCRRCGLTRCCIFLFQCWISYLFSFQCGRSRVYTRVFRLAVRAISPARRSFSVMVIMVSVVLFWLLLFDSYLFSVLASCALQVFFAGWSFCDYC